MSGVTRMERETDPFPLCIAKLWIRVLPPLPVPFYYVLPTRIDNFTTFVFVMPRYPHFETTQDFKSFFFLIIRSVVILESVVSRVSTGAVCSVCQNLPS